MLLWWAAMALSGAAAAVGQSAVADSGVSSRSEHAVPALPRVKAHIQGRFVVGQYEFASWPSDPQTRPWQILVSSLSSTPRYAPLTYEIYPRGRTGEIRQQLTLGRGPFKLLVSVRNRFGGRSKVMTMPLRRAR